MVNHKVVFKTFVDAVLKRMRLAANDASFDWKTLGFVGAQKVANSLQAQVTENEDQTRFSISCKQFRHEFKVEETNFNYTREDQSGKVKFQLKEFADLRAELWKMMEETAHLESMKEVIELRRQEKAMVEVKWRETLRRNPKSGQLKKQRKRELRGRGKKNPPKSSEGSGTDGTETKSSGEEASGTESSGAEASGAQASEEEAEDTEEEETESEEKEAEETESEEKESEETESEESESEESESEESEAEEAEAEAEEAEAEVSEASETSEKPETSDADTE